MYTIHALFVQKVCKYEEEDKGTGQRKTWTGQVLTAAVLQLFLEVRQALGEPGIGLPRQILAAP